MIISELYMPKTCPYGWLGVFWLRPLKRTGCEAYVGDVLTQFRDCAAPQLVTIILWGTIVPPAPHGGCRKFAPQALLVD